MEESLIAAASEIKPKKYDLNDQSRNKKYQIDPETGDKLRSNRKPGSKAGLSKTERKKEKSLYFWDRL